MSQVLRPAGEHRRGSRRRAGEGPRCAAHHSSGWQRGSSPPLRSSPPLPQLRSNSPGLLGVPAAASLSNAPPLLHEQGMVYEAGLLQTPDSPVFSNFESYAKLNAPGHPLEEAAAHMWSSGTPLVTAPPPLGGAFLNGRSGRYQELNSFLNGQQRFQLAASRSASPNQFRPSHASLAVDAHFDVPGEMALRRGSAKLDTLAELYNLGGADVHPPPPATSGPNQFNQQQRAAERSDKSWGLRRIPAGADARRDLPVQFPSRQELEERRGKSEASQAYYGLLLPHHDALRDPFNEPQGDWQGLINSMMTPSSANGGSFSAENRQQFNYNLALHQRHQQQQASSLKARYHQEEQQYQQQQPPPAAWQHALTHASRQDLSCGGQSQSRGGETHSRSLRHQQLFEGGDESFSSFSGFKGESLMELAGHMSGFSPGKSTDLSPKGVHDFPEEGAVEEQALPRGIYEEGGLWRPLEVAKQPRVPSHVPSSHQVATPGWSQSCWREAQAPAVANVDESPVSWLALPSQEELEAHVSALQLAH